MPKPKVTVKSLDELPEGLREFYVQSGDEYVLDIDDQEFKKRINEFRDNNIDLSKKLENANSQLEKLAALQEDIKKFEGIDPEKAKKALEITEKINEKKLLDEGKFEELFNQRTERMKRDYEGQIEALSKNLETERGAAGRLRDQLSDHLINDALQRAVGEVAVPRKGSMRDILARGREVWKLDEEKNVPVPRNAKGDIIYGKEANKPIDMKEWAEGLAADAPFLFEASSGGGSGGSKRRVEGQKQVSWDDQRGLSDNLTAIAEGEVQAVPNS